jgi:hypothetical protein
LVRGSYVASRYALASHKATLEVDCRFRLVSAAATLNAAKSGPIKSGPIKSGTHFTGIIHRVLEYTNR